MSLYKNYYGSPLSTLSGEDSVATTVAVALKPSLDWGIGVEISPYSQYY